MPRMDRPRINQPNSHADENDVAKMARLYRGGMTLRETAKATGFVSGTVRNHLRNAGVALRPRGRRKNVLTRTSLVIAKGKNPYAELSTAADKAFARATSLAEIKLASKLKALALSNL